MREASSANKISLFCGVAITSLIALSPGFAGAQTIPQADGIASADIIVTARKREESLQDVPVVVSAFDAATLERNGVDGFDDLAQITTGLKIYSTGNVGNQGAISLRGIQTGSINLASDQAVTLSVDGVPIESAMGLKAGMFDVQQIEVMKGPQALYFGKNSSGGVISIRTAKPTDELFYRVRAGYEFGARERFGEAIVSGPLASTLKARAGIAYSDMDGWLVNTSDTAATKRVPNSTEWIARGSLLWEPSADFTGHLKVTYTERDAVQSAYQQKFACFRPGQTTAECVLDDRVSQSAPVDVLGRFDSDETFADSRLYIVSLELSYDVSDSLNLSGTTGFYDFRQAFFDSVLPRASTDLFAGNPNEILSQATDEMRGLSQEIRLTSDLDGPLNFMVGGFVDDRKVRSDIMLQFGATANPRNVQTVTSNAHSVFGELSYDVREQLKLTAGARYTKQNRKYSGEILEAVGPFPVGTPLVPLDDELSEDNVSPEVTLTWQPSDAVTAFATYKKGFKSGSFDISSTNNLALLTTRQEIRFNNENVEGFELGFKTMLLARQLRLNGAFYHFDYKGLQLNSYDSSTATSRTVNAAGAFTEGFELEAQFSPLAAKNLTLNAAVNYNRARYTNFITDCSQDQLFSGTCALDIIPSRPGNDSQDLSGRPLRLAPDWTATAGFAYEHYLDDDFLIKVGSTANYSSSYFTEERLDPYGLQGSYLLLNANIGFGPADGRWSVDIIGRNLTDQLFRTTTNPQALTGGGGFRQDYFTNVDRGREVRVQVTFRN